jgi:hypothetical protein
MRCRTAYKLREQQQEDDAKIMLPGTVTLLPLHYFPPFWIRKHVGSRFSAGHCRGIAKTSGRNILAKHHGANACVAVQGQHFEHIP